MCVCVHTFVCACVCVCVCVRVRVCARKCVFFVCESVFVRTSECLWEHTHTAYVRTCTHIHTHTHKHIHTHEQASCIRNCGIGAIFGKVDYNTFQRTATLCIYLRTHTHRPLTDKIRLKTLIGCPDYTVFLYNQGTPVYSRETLF